MGWKDDEAVSGTVEGSAPEVEASAPWETDEAITGRRNAPKKATPEVAPEKGGGSPVRQAAMAVRQPTPENKEGAPSDKPEKQRNWSDVPLEALKNLPESAGNFVSALVQPVLHPKDTANAVISVLDGLGSKISRPGDLRRAGDPEPTAAELDERKKREAGLDAVTDFFVERYGSEEGLKNALATDPVGVAADISTLLTGGGAALARAPGAVGRVGAVAAKVGATVDPLAQTGNAIKATGKLAGQHIVEPAVSNALGVTTGAGAESVRAAARAGAEGGEAAKAFTDNMRGRVPIEEIVDTAKSALEGIRKERAEAYNAGKADLSKDKTVLDFDDIDAKVAKASEIGTYKGQTTEPKAVAITKEMTDSIDAWKQLDPAEFHTPEGLDALKRRLGNIRDAAPERTPERVAADRIYRAVRDEIADQAPGYAKMMEDYSVATDRLKEISRTFSLGERATRETAARKLQSATRDGAQTSWKGRGELLDELSKREPTLPYSIAGQSLNALAPRGIIGRGGAIATAAGAVADPVGTVARLMAFSPRIVGETVYFGGKAAGKINEVADAFGVSAEAVRLAAIGAYQTGRIREITSSEIADHVMKAGSVGEAIRAAEESVQ